MNFQFQQKIRATFHRPSATVVLLFCAFICVGFATELSGAETNKARRVLLINSFGREFSPWDSFAGNFRSKLVLQLSHPPDFFEVSLESARFSNPQEEPVVNYLTSLFAGRPLDLVVPIGGPAVRFAQKYRQQLFAKTPMLFTAVDQRHIQNTSFTSNDTMVAIMNDLPGAVENILHILPQTTNIVVVIGNSPLEQFWLDILRRELQPFTNRISFVWLNDLALPEMLDRCASLPPHSAIFYTLMIIDAAGVSHVEERALTELHKVARAPIFGLHSTQMGRGIVGGPLISVDELSRNAAAAARRILRGDPPADIKTPAQKAGDPIFDWRELRRWGIKEDSLPKGSTVLFRELTLWQKYKNRIIAIAALVLLQAVIIFALLANLIKRRRAEQSLAESEARFRVAANTAPVMIWMAGPDKLFTFLNKSWLEFTGRPLEQELGDGWTKGVHPDDFTAGVKTYEESFDARREFTMEYRIRRQDGDYAWIIDRGLPRFATDGAFLGYIGAATDITALKQAEERWRVVVESAPDAMLVINSAGKITLVNKRLETVFDYKRSELIGQPVEILLPEGTHHGDYRKRFQTNPTARAMRAVGELFGRRKDGSLVPVEVGFNPIRTLEGEFLLVSIIDITDRLAAEAKLRESEKRMTMAADAANLGMWIWEVPETKIWTSEKWKIIHGFTRTEDVCYETLVERIHPEDRYFFERAVADALSDQSAFHVQHRLSLPDETVRWISTSGRVEATANKGTLRLMGISIDISERKETEKAAREVSGKLITAQEDERRRIARDLHDDLNQRLALLSVETDLLGRMDNKAPAQALITNIASRVQDISSEVHKLSYQLHPAKLEQLGLVAATRSFCHELSRQHSIPIEFAHDDIPRDLNGGVSLCLYRIVQEGLQNVVKHSRATRVRVELRGRKDQIILAVTDDGLGFDMRAIGHQPGLGLVGMRERVRLVQGDILFRSAPDRGTRIEVTVPLFLS